MNSKKNIIIITSLILTFIISVFISFIYSSKKNNSKNQIKEYSLKKNNKSTGMMFFANEEFLKNRINIDADFESIDSQNNSYEVAIESTTVSQKKDINKNKSNSALESMQKYAKKLFGLDILKTFNIDIDEEREIFQNEMREMADDNLKKEMLQQGIDDENINKFMSIRKSIRKKIKDSKPGVYNYKINVEQK